MAMPLKSTDRTFYNADSGKLEIYEQPREGGMIHKRNFPLVTVDLSCSLPTVELTKLYRMIEKALGDKRHRMVQFISPNREQDVNHIAAQTALVAARLIGQRVLFIDTSMPLPRNKKMKSVREPINKPTSSLETLLLEGASPYEAIAQAAGTELYFARLCSEGNAGPSPVTLTSVENALQHLRTYFDMIILDSQNILNDAFAMGLAKLADGSVMVVEAERTRAPVAAECKRLVEASGGRLIGAVMNRRRLYIPDTLYRTMYQRDTL